MIFFSPKILAGDKVFDYLDYPLLFQILTMLSSSGRTLLLIEVDLYEKVKVEMTKIRRRFSRFEGHVEGIKQQMGESRDILGQIKRDIEEFRQLYLMIMICM